MKLRHQSYKVPDYFGCASTTKGEIGVEIETIGKNLPLEMHDTTLWKAIDDASIKVRPGEFGKEYVMVQPIGRAKLDQALDELHKEFKRCGSEVAEGRISNSVHVHINAQPLTIQQVYTWLTLYHVFEEILVRWAGPDRVGNLFCLRAKDAEGLIRMLARAAADDNFKTFNSKSYRYSAVNVMSLPKYGSLEFRALRGTVDSNIIKQWVDVLLQIKNKSFEYKNPTDVLADFSRRSPIGMANHVLTPELRAFAFQQVDFMDVMWEGARLAQDYAFSTTWDGKTYEKPKDVPKSKTKSTLNEYIELASTPDPFSTMAWAASPSTPQPATAQGQRYFEYQKHHANGLIYASGYLDFGTFPRKYGKLSTEMLQYFQQRPTYRLKLFPYNSANAAGMCWGIAPENGQRYAWLSEGHLTQLTEEQYFDEQGV